MQYTFNVLATKVQVTKGSPLNLNLSLAGLEYF